MFSRDQLSQLAELYPPASVEHLERVEGEMSWKLPTDYRELLLCSNGLVPVVNEDRYAISLFHLEELAEFQAAYEIPERCPGHILIGFDGGCRGLFLKLAKQSQVYLSETSAIEHDELRVIANDLRDWVSKEFDLADPPDQPSPSPIDIYLVQAPKGGLKQLREICKKLKVDVPLSQLRTLMNNLPVKLGGELPFYPFHQVVQSLNTVNDCLVMTEVGHPLPGPSASSDTSQSF